jgi:ketosteroid isomerase-like protein
MTAVAGVCKLPTLDTNALPWVPTGPGKAFKPLRFWPGGWSELMRLEPGAGVALHRHTGIVDAIVLQGERRTAGGEVLGAGAYQHEPAGTVDAWAAQGEQACIVHLRIEGEIQYLGPSGDVAEVVDATTQARTYAQWCAARNSSPSVPLPGSLGEPGAPGNPWEDRQGVAAARSARAPEDVSRLVVECLNAGDAEAAAELYEADATLAHPIERPLRGREEIRALYRQLVDAGVRFAFEEPLPTVRFQDLALTSTRSADGSGTRVQVLRRQPDGSWLRIIDRPEEH